MKHGFECLVTKHCCSVKGTMGQLEQLLQVHKSKGWKIANFQIEIYSDNNKVLKTSRYLLIIWILIFYPIPVLKLCNFYAYKFFKKDSTFLDWKENSGHFCYVTAHIISPIIYYVFCSEVFLLWVPNDLKNSASQFRKRKLIWKIWTIRESQKSLFFKMIAFF